MVDSKLGDIYADHAQLDHDMYMRIRDALSDFRDRGVDHDTALASLRRCAKRDGW